MTHYRTVLPVSIAIALLTFCAPGLRSQTVLQPRYAIDQGGGKGTAGGHTLFQSVGQPFIQKGAGATLSLGEGFLAPQAGGAGNLVATSLAVSGGWNMLSLPLEFPDSRKTTLFPTAVSNAFMFTTMYMAVETLRAGVGYWVKFRGPEDVGLTGYPRPADTIEVHQGWNLVGTVSGALAAAAVGSVPGGLVVSNFFGFEDAYIAADSLRPGKGYWVKASADGSLILTSSQSPAAARVRIVPDEDRPPGPPGNPGAVTSGVLPDAYALYQNYPNPFNPETEIRYDLPAAGEVILRVYNVLGEEVATVVAGTRDAGFRSEKFDASALPSGVYIYRLTTGNFSMARKMIVLK